MTDAAYIFLDESGNLDFSDKGTRYFALTAVSLRRPFAVYEALDSYKHDCIEYGLTTEYFHCSNDNIHVRGKVFDIIGCHLDAMRISSLIVEKRRVDPQLREPAVFYSEMVARILKPTMLCELGSDGKVIAITDSIPFKHRRRIAEENIRTALEQALPDSAKWQILHHASSSHYGLQVADYCCWAMHQKWEKNRPKWFDHISPSVRHEVSIP